MSYTMDDRKFKLLPNVEYKDIAIMEKKGEVFYISREKQENIVIFLKTVTDKSMWFDSEEYPELFKSFGSLYNELGKLDYQLYGYRNTENKNEIFFFDLKIIKSFNDYEWVYHDDFISLCEKCNLPICYTHARGEFSLKTIKKLLVKINLGEQDLLFKPTCEHTFGIIEKSEEAQQVLPFQSKRNKRSKKTNTTTISPSMEKASNQQTLYDIIADLENPLLFNGIDNYDKKSLKEYIDYFTNPKFDKNYIEAVLDEGFYIGYLSKPEIKDFLTKHITSLILEISCDYMDLIYNDMDTCTIHKYSISLEAKIQEEVLKQIDDLTTRIINKSNLY